MGDYTILSLDLASTVGFAVGRNGVIVDSGEVPLKPPGNKTHPGHRIARFQRLLHELKDRWNFNEIVFEDVPRFESAAAAKIFGALWGQMHLFTRAFNLRSQSMFATTVKKEFSGAGNAKKNDMCNVALNLGWKNGARDTAFNNNECDAIALLWCIYKRRNIDATFIKIEIA